MTDECEHNKYPDVNLNLSSALHDCEFLLQSAKAKHSTQWRSDPKAWAALCIAIEAVQLTTLGIFFLIKPLRGNNVHHYAECELRHSEWLDNLPEGTQEVIPQQETER